MKKSVITALISKASSLVPNTDMEFLRLGEILDEINEAVADQTEFVEILTKIGVGYRKARYLIETSRAFRTINATEVQVKLAGWTKCSLIAPYITPYITPENAEKLLEMALASSVSELRAFLDSGKKEELKAFVLFLNNEQHARLDAALAKRGAKQHGRHVIGKVDAFMRMIDDADRE